MAKHYYYIDASCGADFDVVLERSQFFAARALERLDDPADTQFASVFELIFKTPAADARPVGRCPGFQPAPGQSPGEELRPRPVLGHVRRELQSLARGWLRTGERRQAELRVHWDGGRRYRELRPLGVQADPVNHLVCYSSRAAMDGVFAARPVAVLRDHPPDLRLTPKGEHPRRVVVDLTQRARDSRVTWEACQLSLLADHPVCDLADSLVEVSLIDAMLRCRAYGLVDFSAGDQQAAGWRLISGLTRDQSYICARSIALLCLVAGLGELKGLSLPYGYRYTISEQGSIVGYPGNPLGGPLGGPAFPFHHMQSR